MYNKTDLNITRSEGNDCMEQMPVLFVGHGSPMNAIEDNEFTEGWKRAAEKIPAPRAILAVSAHWYTPGLRVSDTSAPKMIYDMYGFPDALYRVVYNAPGAPELAHRVRQLLRGEVRIDNGWGIDHGAWSVLRRMYPNADIPLCQLSVDRDASPREQFAVGQKIASLREEGILILGSGNVVHNLARVAWEMDKGFPWADAFDHYVKEKIAAGDFGSVIEYGNAGPSAKLSVPTPDHYDPLLCVLGAVKPGDKVTVFNESGVLGSLSMTSYLFG